MSECPAGFAPTYGVELLCQRSLAIDRNNLLRALRKRCPRVEFLDKSESSKLLAFAHPDRPVHFEKGSVPAQTVIIPADAPFKITESVTAAIEQSWDFPLARATVEGCRAAVLVSDFLSRLLDYRERFTLFQNVLAGVLEIIPALAINWQPTQRIVDPQRYLKAHAVGGSALFFASAINVRIYSISNSPGDQIMDTLGLAALGLPDLQCHFRGRDTGQLARLLYNTAYYVFEQGDMIKNGHTVEGLPPGSRWRCCREESILQPTRVVLDLDPGPPHAAGGRRTGENS